MLSRRGMLKLLGITVTTVVMPKILVADQFGKGGIVTGVATPPYHPNCCCTHILDAQKYAIAARRSGKTFTFARAYGMHPEKIRVAMNGQLPADTTFEQWKELNKERIRESVLQAPDRVGEQHIPSYLRGGRDSGRGVQGMGDMVQRRCTCRASVAGSPRDNERP